MTSLLDPQQIPDASAALFVLMLLVAGNYLQELFGCRLQKLLRESIIAKHIVGVLFLLFFAVIIDPSIAKLHLANILLMTAILYAWFIVIVRSPNSITVPVIALLMLVYLMNLRKRQLAYGEEDDTERKVKQVTYIQTAVTVLAAVLSILGFVIYMAEKMREYGDDFSFAQFVVGKVDCRNYTPSSAKLLKFMDL